MQNDSKSIVRLGTDNTLLFWCPGCDEAHGVNVGDQGWAWNGLLDLPTINPSIRVRSGHYIPGHIGECWCNNPEYEYKCRSCHSYVRNGQIEFLSDSTHDLAGKIVNLPLW